MDETIKFLSVLSEAAWAKVASSLQNHHWDVLNCIFCPDQDHEDGEGESGNGAASSPVSSAEPEKSEDQQTPVMQQQLGIFVSVQM